MEGKREGGEGGMEYVCVCVREREVLLTITK
jgi:hypothetical protein